jgi:hypothetical protein
VLAQITANDQTAKREGVLVAKANVDLKDDRIDDIEDVRSYIGEYRKKAHPIRDIKWDTETPTSN